MTQKDLDFLKNREALVSVEVEKELSEVLHGKDSNESKAQLLSIIDSLMSSLSNQNPNSPTKSFLEGKIGDE